MTINEAATELTNKYIDQPWFQAVGMASNGVLHLYCQKKINKSLADKFEQDGYNGFKIKVIHTGPFSAR